MALKCFSVGRILACVASANCHRHGLTLAGSFPVSSPLMCIELPIQILSLIELPPPRVEDLGAYREVVWKLD